MNQEGIKHLRIVDNQNPMNADLINLHERWKVTLQ